MPTHWTELNQSKELIGRQGISSNRKSQILFIYSEIDAYVKSYEIHGNYMKTYAWRMSFCHTNKRNKTISSNVIAVSLIYKYIRLLWFIIIYKINAAHDRSRPIWKITHTKHLVLINRASTIKFTMRKNSVWSANWPEVIQHW